MFAARGIKQQLARFMERYAVLREARDVRHLGFSIPVRNTRREFARDVLTTALIPGLTLPLERIFGRLETGGAACSPRR